MSGPPAVHQKVRALRGQMIYCRNQRYRHIKGSACCECGASLSHWYYEKDGRLFCKKDYWAKFGELCHGCSEPITTGLIMPLAGEQPHMMGTVGSKPQVPMITASLRASNDLGPASSGLPPAVGSASSADHHGRREGISPELHRV
ncbi:hypothetical protein cypCar_00033973 [Cyprinus carpio]|nr:hypothetical protein cypCar_00033973 [Cyprinus carpio]